MKRIVGLIGTCLVIVRVFLPAATIPMHGSISLYLGGHGDGMFMLVAAIPAAIFFALNWYRIGTALGMVTAAMVFLKLIVLSTQLEELARKVTQLSPANLRESIEQAAATNAGLSFAWFILIPGALMMAFAAFVPNRKLGPTLAQAPALPVEPKL